MSRKSRYNALIGYGRLPLFFPSEARELSHTSREGMGTRYFKRMVNSRRALLRNAEQYDWSLTRYRQEVDNLYSDRNAYKTDSIGRLLKDVWKMLRWYEESYRMPDEYESPWRKKIRVKAEDKRVKKRTSRRQMMTDIVAGIDKDLANPQLSEWRRGQLEAQKQHLERLLRELK